MGQWKAKLASVVFVYSAGFLTAIYFLGPQSDKPPGSFKLPQGKTIDRELLFRRINDGLHNCVDLGKDAAGHVAETLREHMNQNTTTSDEGS